MSTRQRKNVGILLVFLIIAGDFIAALLGIGSPAIPRTALGTWQNMPSTDTELMGNQSYRNTLFINSASSQMSVGLQVGCINPSNTLGSNLRLQSATYSTITRTNSTVFADTGSTILIDNSANWPCPGNLQNSQVTLPTQLNAIALIFRVVGTGGGGVGDNPRFSYVNMFLEQNILRIPEATVFSISTTQIRVFIQVTPIVVTISTVENFYWIATNSTSLNCGTGDNCTQGGTNSCTIAAGGNNCNVIITFVTPFTGTVNGVASPKTSISSAVLFTGTMDFLLAQTLTV